MSLNELYDRIAHALQTITAGMLHRVWDKFHYHLVVCRVTQGAHTEGIVINPLNAKLNPICHLLVSLEAHPIFHLSRIRVNA